MAGSTVKTVGYGGAGGTLAPAGKRNAFTLSDGTAVAVIADPNQTGITGDGGDNTGVAKFYVYTSPNRTTWTLRATITPTNAPAQNKMIWAATVGANNNVHICWRDTGGLLRYVLVTYSAGPAYSAGSQETVLSALPTNSNSGYIRRLDMDVAGTGNNCVIAASASLYASGTTANRRAEMRVWVRNNTPTWTAQPTTPIMSAGQWHYLYAEDVSVACDSAGPDGSNLINAVVVLPRKRNDGADLGDVLYNIRMNVATGANTSVTLLNPASITNQGFNYGYGSAFRQYYLFSNAPGQYTLMGLIAINPIVVCTWRFTVSTGAALSNVIALNRNTWSGNAADKATEQYNFFTITYGNNSAVVHVRSPGYIYGIPISLSGGSPTYGSVMYWDESYIFSGVHGQSLHGGGGNNRNFSFNKHDVLWYAGVNGSSTAYRVEWFTNETPAAPKNVLPATSATITTDRPTLSADHYWGTVNVPQTRTRMQWQLASNSGFTTNLRTVDSTTLVNAQNTASPSNAKVTTSMVVPAAAELFQGTWYVRARAVTELGDVGAWSAGQGFVVTHPPTAGNLYPTGDAVFLMDAFGTVSMSWKFSDPSPFDYETGHELVVEDAETGVQVYTTSQSGYANAIGQDGGASPQIGTGVAGTLLRWKVRLRDSDNVQGAYSDYGTFWLVAPADVDITYPGEGATIDTGNPDIAWSVTLDGSRTQTHYRVTILQGAATLYNTGWIASQATSHRLPVGVLANDSQYSAQVEIKDNLNLEALDLNAFSTDWVEPAAPTVTVDSSLYKTAGYVKLTWTNASLDVDFIGYYVYRQVVGSTDWELVSSFNLEQPTYEFRDYLAGSGIAYNYAVVQVVDRFGSIVESVYNNNLVTPTSENYWIIHPLDSAYNIMLRNVTADAYSEEYESAVIQLIGRGRKIDHGDRLGYKGQLTAQLRDAPNGGATARVQKQQLETLKALQTQVYLRNPFGDVWLINLDDMAVDRVAGVGRAEFVNVSIPYQEVAE